MISRSKVARWAIGLTLTGFVLGLIVGVVLMNAAYKVPYAVGQDMQRYLQWGN